MHLQYLVFINLTCKLQYCFSLHAYVYTDIQRLLKGSWHCILFRGQYLCSVGWDGACNNRFHMCQWEKKNLLSHSTKLKAHKGTGLAHRIYVCYITVLYNTDRYVAICTGPYKKIFIKNIHAQECSQPLALSTNFLCVPNYSFSVNACFILQYIRFWMTRTSLQKNKAFVDTDDLIKSCPCLALLSTVDWLIYSMLKTAQVSNSFTDRIQVSSAYLKMQEK